MVNNVTDSDADSEESKSTQKPKNENKVNIKLVLVGLLIIALAVFNFLQWRQIQSLKADEKEHKADFDASRQKVSDLEKQLTEEKAKSATPTADNTVTPPSAAAIENIKASISSGNTAALAGYMAPTVRVIIAASEGIGDRTPTQAIKDLDYLDEATDPWNFALPPSTLSQYATGSYGQFFPSTAVVGRSANKYVVSFTFNNSGKISGIFMCVNADLLL